MHRFFNTFIMRKIYILLVTFLVCGSVWAQDIQPVHIGVRVGVNGSSILVPHSTIDNMVLKGYNSQQKFNVGGSAGVYANFRIAKNVSLQTGLYYSYMRLGQSQSSFFTDTNNINYSIGSDNDYRLHRLRLPLMVNYHFSEGPKHVVVGAGLYFDCALSGQLTYDASFVLQSPNGSKSSYFADGDCNPFMKDMKYLYYREGQSDYVQKYALYEGNLLNRFDMGACLELGYQISKAYIGIRADFGFLNIVNENFYGKGFKERNLNLQLMIGYQIN